MIPPPASVTRCLDNMAGRRVVLGALESANEASQNGGSRSWSLDLRQVGKSYGSTMALRGVSYTFHAGRIYGLCGANGAGKSTLVKIMSGLLPSYFGHLTICEKERHFTSYDAARRSGIRALQQETDLNLFTEMTVEENYLFRTTVGNGWERLLTRDRRRRAREGLQAFGSLAERLRVRVRNLTLAERQLLAISAAIDPGARLIILDEPTASLSREAVPELFATLRRLREEGVAIVYISHLLEEVAALVDEVVVLRAGTIVDRFSSSAMVTHRDAVQRIVRAMVGDEGQGAARNTRGERAVGRVLLDVKNLESPAGLAGISLQVAAGEIVALTGGVGSGMRVVTRAICGLEPGAKGEVRVDGRLLPVGRRTGATADLIGYVPEDRRRALYLDRTVRWNMTLPILRKLRGRAGFLRRKSGEDVVAPIADRVGLPSQASAVATGSLSGGNQQRVVIGRWLAGRRKALVLNEPTRGVDPMTRQRIYELLRDLVREEKMAILVSTYDPEEAVALADRVIVMRRGSIVMEREVNERTLAEVLGVVEEGVEEVGARGA